MFIIISSTLYVLRLRDDKNNNNNNSVEYNRDYSDNGLGEEDRELDFDLDLEENKQIHGDSRDIGIPLHEITSGSSRRSEAVEEFPTARRNSTVWSDNEYLSVLSTVTVIKHFSPKLVNYTSLRQYISGFYVFIEYI